MHPLKRAHLRQSIPMKTGPICSTLSITNGNKNVVSTGITFTWALSSWSSLVSHIFRCSIMIYMYIFPEFIILCLFGLRIFGNAQAIFGRFHGNIQNNKNELLNVSYCMSSQCVCNVLECSQCYKQFKNCKWLWEQFHVTASWTT